MINQLAERTIARILGIGSAFVAVYVMGFVPVADPVNVTKLFVLGGVAAGSFAVLLAFGARELWASSKSLVVLAGLLIATGINAVVNSNGPLVQNLYGVYGRNTAFVTYILLIFVLLAAAVLRARASFTILIWGLLTAGFVNVAYCIWAINFGDFIPWSNPYGQILGTFGNPNFIGAFLGLFAASLVAYSFKPGVSLYLRIGAIFVFLIAIYEIVESHAIQGRVVVAAGLAIVGFFLVRSKFKNAIFQIGYTATIFAVGLLALLGALQSVP